MEINKDTIENVKMAVQINGKTRDVIDVNKDMSEKQIKEFILKNSKAKNYIENNNLKKVIFVKNRIINYIIQLNEKNKFILNTTNFCL